MTISTVPSFDAFGTDTLGGTTGYGSPLASVSSLAGGSAGSGSTLFNPTSQNSNPQSLLNSALPGLQNVSLNGATGLDNAVGAMGGSISGAVGNATANFFGKGNIVNIAAVVIGLLCFAGGIYGIVK